MSDPIERTISEMTDADVLIWHASTAELLSDVVARRLMSALSREERARHAGFVFAENGAEFLLAHAMKRIVIGRYTGVPPRDLAFVADQNGKPGLAAQFGMGRIGFSLSHSGGVVVVAIAATTRVGVDVESTRRTVSAQSIIAALSEREAVLIDRLRGHERRRCAFAHWTAREAFSKAVGLGLSLPREDVSFEISGNDQPTLVDVGAEYGQPV